MAQAANRLAEESEAAQLVLRQAQDHLATLSAQARQLRAAEEAAAALAAAQRSAATTSEVVGPVTALGIPAPYEQAYRAAAGTCAGLRWTLLAAVGQVESGHGRNNGPSSAGAIGPMQFMPATFASYGVDGDGDGKADPWNPADAIPAAARYLCASGLDASDAGVQRALLAYNHAQWYVDLVLAAERAIIARGA
ncbi:MAG: lytic transglycosylase domain-containing protein [Kineosporiaceae bacterium]|nr:lytic transglycosylase domain-containing protein [Kineosporiaceae bacterium]MBK7624912.1 lytic transglycosylase domain-containing protein [Kineosporiaceae bacterium]MBK8076709.1 lytic transglycosylase domain-containing protein [Kineosporiaceae bacterium]